MENSLDIPDAGQIKSNLARMKDKYNAYLHKLYWAKAVWLAIAVGYIGKVALILYVQTYS